MVQEMVQMEQLQQIFLEQLQTMQITGHTVKCLLMDLHLHMEIQTQID